VPKVVDHEKRRAEILEQCFDLFAEHGYGAMTMRKLAAALGVSTGTLYHYFDGKPALFEAMFRWLRARDVQAALEGLPGDATQAVRLARLGEFLTTHQESLQQAVRVALDYHRHAPDAESRLFVAETVREYHGALREQLGLTDHPELARVLFSFLIGMSVHGILDPGGVVVDHHLAVLGLAAQAVVGVEGA
jgi:AcrR family transcriptional regulator